MTTRRVFIKNGSLALLSLGFAPMFIARSAQAAQARKKVLVAIFQRGAVDGLNMVVPYGDNAYYKSRPSIAIPRPAGATTNDGAVDLDGFFGLHPRMRPLADLFHRNELAIVHACGSPDETRSHFDAQDYMETATPGVKAADGWLNRYLHAKEHEQASPFRAVALATQLPRTLQGKEPALAINQLSQFGVRAGAASNSMEATFEAQYAAAADALLAPTGKEAFDAVKMLRNTDPGGYTPSNGAEYPRSPFGDAMRQIAQLVKAELGLEVAFAELTGWDTHVNQGNSQGQLANRLDDFARALAAFNTDMADRMAEVVVVTMSEFGRAVNENGNRGTDHGHGNAMLIFGGPIKGGKVYGRWPGLEMDQRWQGRDLAITTDFRNVFADLVSGHLGAKSVDAIFPGFKYPGQLGFLRT